MVELYLHPAPPQGNIERGVVIFKIFYRAYQYNKNIKRIKKNIKLLLCQIVYQI
jgi:hypothetical protein